MIIAGGSSYPRDVDFEAMRATADEVGAMIMADIAVINKVDTAESKQIEKVRRNITTHAPGAEILLAESRVLVSEPDQIKGKKVLVVEDSIGEFVDDVEFAVQGQVPVHLLGVWGRHDVSGSGVIHPDRILEEVKSLL